MSGLLLAEVIELVGVFIEVVVQQLGNWAHVKFCCGTELLNGNVMKLSLKY